MKALCFPLTVFGMSLLDHSKCVCRLFRRSEKLKGEGAPWPTRGSDSSLTSRLRESVSLTPFW